MVVGVCHDWWHSVAYIKRLNGLEHGFAVARLKHGQHSRRELATLKNQLQTQKRLQRVSTQVSGAC
jgi:hypothetical protein